MSSREIKLLSVVVPCHNEEEVLPDTHGKLSDILGSLQKANRFSQYEIIYIDNGSTDETLAVLKDIFHKDKHVRIISLRRNFGYQGSISAGLFYAKGCAVVTIDADLQDPPEKIDEMISGYENNYDLVLGVRSNRLTDSLGKRFFSVNYYRLMNSMGVEIVHNHGDFRLMARPLVDKFNTLPERNRLIRAMILQLDSKFAIVMYKRQPRAAGKSKFNVYSLLSLCWEGIVSFSIMPLRIAFVLGAIISIFSMIASLWVLYIKLVTNVIPGWASTLLPIFVLGGLQMLLLGLLGEYIGRLYIEVKQRPLFFTRAEYTHDENENRK